MKQRGEKVDAKQVVLPHSKAKLDLYKNYLEHYLRVLGHADFCTKINLYDIYCGMGQYDDGNFGSPLITNECIKESIIQLENNGKVRKPISVTINDHKKEKINNVINLLKERQIQGCSYSYHNEDANVMLDRVSTEVNSFEGTERNLVFIDPYGYSNITKEKLYHLLKNEATEVILFLPISQMYRFSEIALNDTERTCYEQLRKFIFSFFPANHKIHSIKLSGNLEFIYEIKNALRFDNQFFSCSHYIERDKGNYYALFFITSNMYGLEKMVDSKWALDPIKGKGFDQKRSGGMFEAQFQEFDNKQQIEFLKELILKYLQKNGHISNDEIYVLGLMNEFRPKDVVSVIKGFMNGGRVEGYKSSGQKLVGNDNLYINYQQYKWNANKIIFKFIR